MMQTGSSIRFWHRGSIRSLEIVDPTRTVLEWLREDEGLTGSKEGCAEGDCGACTALMARFEAGRLVVCAVNSCIVLLPMLDGQALFTVEDLVAADGTFHPAHLAMLDAVGSQCGFCTPGIVMALAGLHYDTRTPTRQQVLDQLAGNLCRCTGYGPIIEAATRMGEIAPKSPLVPPDLVKELKSLHSDVCLEGGSADARWFAPATSDDLANLLAAHPGATLVAGATDIGLWVTKQLKTFECLIFLHRVEELSQIRETEAGLEIGAMVNLARVRNALAHYSPDIDELLRRFGSEQVRAFGTIGGNIANGSPIGDMPPALIAAGARLRLRQGKKRRDLPLEDFFIDYGKQDLKPGEFVEGVLLPPLEEGLRLHIHKLSKRFDQDISAVCGAFGLRIVDGVVEDARIAFGGMAGIPKRARQTEAALIGSHWCAETIEQAMIVLEKEFSPLADQRGSDTYRKIAARNLLKKVWLETQTDQRSLSLVRFDGQAAYA
ncbi:MAG: xanthine dehydrogenase small subunit [Pseudomonadota bacterium]